MSVRAGTVPALLLALVTLAGCSSGTGPAPGQSDPATPVSASAPAPGPLAPVEIEVPAIGARSTSMVGLGRDAAGGWAIPPLDQPGQASWYSDGVVPGEPGPAVILGHINGCGEGLTPEGTCVGGVHADGVFANLAKVRAGDVATVAGADGRRVEFVAVRDAQTIDKAVFPTGEVLGATAERELRLISCGGVYDPAGRRYLGNVIVTMVAR